VLLDEIEKAHSDVFNILLQVMDEGRLTDSFGRKVSFSNALLIMTSNIGTDILKKQGSLGFEPSGGIKENFDSDYKFMKDKLLEEAKKTFKPEFLNRLDDVIVFKRLTHEDSGKIVDIEVSFVLKRLAEKGMNMTIGDKVKDFLIEKGFDPMYGARPVRRAIQRYLEDPLAEELISGNLKSGVPIRVTVKNNEYLSFSQNQKIAT
jgi:ATP-dependent Clp protease ATP-binding subunit ClpC